MIRRFMRDERGSQIVEFVLIVPLLLFLIFMVPTLGMAVRAWMVIESAAREGARVVSLTSSAQEARDAAWKEVVQFAGLPTGSGNKVLFANSVEFIQVDAAQGEVTVIYYQPTFLPYLGTLLGGEKLDDYIRLQGRSRFRPEYQSL